ncbi:MAG TPA: lipoyl(octanoyl) transferase LipB [Chitinophagales bacterium]|nr:lipoyl(octanoyl) transferase LipB [Chitinophagales bacterium]
MDPTIILPLTRLAARNVRVADLGKIDFKSAWDLQEELVKELVEIKVQNRERTAEDRIIPEHHFLLCEHYPVITLGKNGSMKNLLLTQDGLNDNQISFFKINRGGDITYHGPGQLVGYPILDLDYFFTDIGKYLRLVEETIILTLKEYGIEAGRSEGETGVWLEPSSPSRARKICAIGIRCTRWITMHGFAFNVNTNLDHFNFIVPCGIGNKQVTSLQKELGRDVELDEVKEKIKRHFAQLFSATLV